MSTENLTAEQALEEMLDKVVGDARGWRHRLRRIDTVLCWPDSVHLNRGFTIGDLRRWSAPLLSIPSDD